jgi:aerobic-type carbon monoxide dehydrogenase small subunit (CoxS/CutS family)
VALFGRGQPGLLNLSAGETPMEQAIQFTLNGRPVRIDTDGQRRLLWVLRSDLGLTGTKCGCGQGHCGACTVLVNSEPIRSCSMLLQEVRGKEVVTIEGLARNGTLHPVQKAFLEHDALQCGFCTPGMIVQAVAFLDKNPRPGRGQILKSLEHNLCRCGAHKRIILAIETAARNLSGGVKP